MEDCNYKIVNILSQNYLNLKFMGTNY